MIKWSIKWMFRLAFLVVLAVVLLFVFKDSIQRTWVEYRIRSETGMDARIGKYTSRLTSSIITIEDLKLYNTAEFGGTLFMSVPEVHIELDPVALARREIHVKLLRCNVAEFAVVKNESGQTNLSKVLTKVRDRLWKKNGGGGSDFEFVGIDLLNLTLAKTKFVDLKDARNNRETPVALENQLFKNIKSEDDIQGVVFILWLRSGGNLAMGPPGLKQSGQFAFVATLAGRSDFDFELFSGFE